MKNINKFKHLPERELKALVRGLLKGYKVYGTVERDGHPAFSEIRSPDELKLSMTPAHLSAKEFLFPQREVLLRFNIRNATHAQVVEAHRQAIIGLHPCDIKGLALMDRVFSGGVADPNYLARRNETFIIGVDCMPDEYCFCQSLGNTEAKDGFDLFLHRLPKGYLVRVGSEKGREVLSDYAATRDATGKEIDELKAARKRREEAFKARIEARPEDLPGVYARASESPVWEKIGARCYSCGSCNNVCPTCYCFDVRDEVRPNLSDGERVRTWDGCTLEDFASVAGGHNFRKTRAERLRHRFNRKFRYLADAYDSLFCIGCGRCSRACLAKINIVEVTNEIIREDNKR